VAPALVATTPGCRCFALSARLDLPTRFASPSRFAPPLPLPDSSGPMLCHASTGGPTRANPNGVARASVRAMKAGSTSNGAARASARAMPPMRPDAGIVYLRWSYGLQFPSCCTFFFRFSFRFSRPINLLMPAWFLRV